MQLWGEVKFSLYLIKHQAGLEAVVNRKIFFPCRESNPGRPARRYPSSEGGGEIPVVEKRLFCFVKFVSLFWFIGYS
jgi:hypothetical protein